MKVSIAKTKQTMQLDIKFEDIKELFFSTELVGYFSFIRITLNKELLKIKKSKLISVYTPYGWNHPVNMIQKSSKAG